MCNLRLAKYLNNFKKWCVSLGLAKYCLNDDQIKLKISFNNGCNVSKMFLNILYLLDYFQIYQNVTLIY
jgi:hypothetical protein